MSTITLPDRTIGQTIDPFVINDIHSALKDDFVGRNSSTGAAEAGKNLGTTLFPWGDAFITRLVIGGVSISSVVGGNPYKIISGATRSATKDQPAFLQPSGSTNSCSLLASTKNLLIETKGVQGTFVANQTLAGLTVATGVGNTCTVNDAAAVGQAATRMWGETLQDTNDEFFLINKVINISAAGAAITAKIGTYAAFRTGTEPTASYFVAFISSATVLSSVSRGIFFDSTLTPRKRQVLTNGQTITLVQLAYVFADSDGVTLDVTNNNPLIQSTTPSAPVIGDYWFDTTVETWKRYNGATFVTVSRLPIGMTVTDTAITRAARSFEFGAIHSRDCFLVPVQSTNTTVVQAQPFGTVSIYGKNVPVSTASSWTMVTDFADASDMYNLTIQNNTTYYFYVSNRGELKISDVEPSYRPELRGFYHPYNMWRLVYRTVTNGAGILLRGGAPVDPSALFISQTPTPFSQESAVFAGSNATAVFATVAGSTLNFNGLGRPVWVTLKGNPASAPAGFFQLVANANQNVLGSLVIRRDGVVIGRTDFGVAGNANPASSITPVCFGVIDRPTIPGSYAYDCQISIVGTTGGGRIASVGGLIIQATQL